MKLETRIPDTLEVEQIRQLFSRNGFDRTVSVNSHIYRQRLGRSPVCCLCFENDALGGLYAVVPADFKVGVASVNAYQSLDTMVDGSLRGKKVFQKTASDVYSHISNMGATLVYGFPNGNSYKGFKQYLGWTFLDPVPFLVRPIRISYFFKPSLFKKYFAWLKVPVFSTSKKGIGFSNELPESEDFKGLCERFCRSYEVGVKRSLEYLASRYKNYPERQYQFVRFHSPDTGRLCGVAVFCIEKKHGGTIGYIMEIIFEPDRPSIAGILVNAVLRNMSHAGCDCVLAWCFSHSPAYSSFLRNLFLPLPERLRPIELHFGYRCFGDLDEAKLADKKSWYLSYSDSDTV